MSAIHTEAQTLYGTARELIAAATVLHLNDSDRFIPSINLLMGFACEMLMKSALAQNGVAASDRHGHDLSALYSKADGKGLLQFVRRSSLRDMIDILDKAHKENSLRYLKPGSSVGVITSVGAAIDTLNEFDAHVRKVVVG